MHAAALEEMGLSGWRYQRLPLPPDVFAGAVAALPALGFRGINVTIPHKEAALRLADDASPTARAVGAANTLTFQDGRIHADNTDVTGLLETIPDPTGRTALVLGAGGAGRAAVHALVQAGAARVESWNRTASRAREVADELGAVAVERPSPADLVVNTTAVGLEAGDDTFKSLPVSADTFHAGSTVVDMVYRAGGTDFLTAARSRGAETVDGLEILVAQGAASLRRWTGRPVPRSAMRQGAEEQMHR